MRSFFLATALALSTATVAFATEAPSALKAGQNAATIEAMKPARTLYICENSALTRRAFAREFGSVEFVKADVAYRTNETWSTPRCITQAEADRLRQRMARAR